MLAPGPAGTVLKAASRARCGHLTADPTYAPPLPPYIPPPPTEYVPPLLQIYSQYLEAREKVLGQLAPDVMQAAARRLFPLPCSRCGAAADVAAAAAPGAVRAAPSPAARGQRSRPLLELPLAARSPPLHPWQRPTTPAAMALAALLAKRTRTAAKLEQAAMRSPSPSSCSAAAASRRRHADSLAAPLLLCSRYTAITMVPRQPGLLQRALLALATSSKSRRWAAAGAGLLTAVVGLLLVRRLQRGQR
jgi:hypothetical protein